MSKRKRRRGTSSSSKKVNPLKIVLVTGGILLAVLGIVLLAGRSGVESWLRGEGFRNFLTEKTAKILKSEVSLGATSWEGSQLYAQGFSAAGYPDAAFARLNLDSVRATYDGAKNGAYFIPEVKINRMNLDFSPHRKKRRYPPPTGADEGGAPVPGWLLAWLPQRVEIKEIRIDAGNLEVHDANDEEQIGLKSVRTVVNPDLESGTWRIQGQGGELFIEGQAKLRLKSMALRWQGRNLFLNQFTLGIFQDGHVEGLGEVGFESSPPQLDLDLKFSRIDVHDLMKDEAWKTRFSGTLRGTVRVTGSPDHSRKEGTIHLEDGLLKSLPILETISAYTRSPRFKRLALNEAHSDFVRQGERIELRNLVVQSDGLLRMEGAVDIDGDQLRGDLQVGVVPGTLRWIPGAERSVFTESREGFLWTGMKLTGTTSQPQEDLSGRLIIAAGESILKELPAETLERAGQLLDSEMGAGGAAGEVIDQGKKVMDLLNPLLFGQ